MFILNLEQYDLNNSDEFCSIETNKDLIEDFDQAFEIYNFIFDFIGENDEFENNNISSNTIEIADDEQSLTSEICEEDGGGNYNEYNNFTKSGCSPTVFKNCRFREIQGPINKNIYKLQPIDIF